MKKLHTILLRQALSSVVDEKDWEIYEYGIRLLFAKFVHIITILAIGWIADELLSITFFLLSYKSIREYSGGHHSRSSLGCYLVTIFITVIVAIFCKFEILYHYTLLMVLPCSSMIWLLSPIETEHKPLEDWEIPNYRKKARIVLILCLTSALIFHFLLPVLERGIICALCMQSIMLFVSLIERKFKKAAEY